MVDQIDDDDDDLVVAVGHEMMIPIAPVAPAEWAPGASKTHKWTENCFAIKKSGAREAFWRWCAASWRARRLTLD